MHRTPVSASIVFNEIEVHIIKSMRDVTDQIIIVMNELESDISMAKVTGLNIYDL